MDLLERLYCELVLHALKTREAWRHTFSTGDLLTKQAKVSKMLNIELAYAAHRKGMIRVKTEEHCRDVADVIQAYHETTLSLMISDCPRR